MSAWRHYTVLVCFLLAASGLCARVVYLGVTERSFLQEQGDARSVRREVIPAMRGVISDRQGEPLAVSTPVYAIWTDPSKASFAAEDLNRLAQQIDVPVVDVRARLVKYANKEFVYLKRRASYDMAQAVLALKDELELDHVYLQPEYRRYYPAGETAAHVVGLTDVDDTGIEGIEYAFDERLKGAAGGKLVLKDRRGDTIRDLEYLGAPVYGQDMRLSIDMGLQFTAYRELKSAVTSHQAKSGSVVMLDAQTGEVLALVNQPSYNPNDIAGHLAGMRNRAVTDAYEPGSTIKPFTALAALESGRYNHRTPIDTAPGYFHIGAKMIEDPVNRNVLTLSEAIAHSSQVAFAKIALDLDNDAVFDVLRRASVGDYVGTGLPGEAAGYIDSGQLRYPVVRAAMAYGYGLSVTPLQLASAYLTLATKGVRKPLSVIKGGHTQAGERVFDAALVDEVVAMMESVATAGGTAPAAELSRYRVAGKTGTARIVGPDGYDDERHAAWFAGIVPVSNPRLVVVVLVNEPRAGVSGGGAVAAPVFARIAERALPMMGVLPDKMDTRVVRHSGDQHAGDRG